MKNNIFPGVLIDNQAWMMFKISSEYYYMFGYRSMFGYNRQYITLNVGIIECNLETYKWTKFYV